MAKPWDAMLVFFHLTLVVADLQVFLRSEPFILVADFLDEEANFGDEVPKQGISTLVVMAEPEYACSEITPPPVYSNPTNHWAVLIKRGDNCTFETKVRNAQNANYDVAIVHNNGSNKLEIMNASDPDSIHIVSVFITANAGKEIKAKYLYNKGVIVRIEPNSSTDILGKILFPFVVVISVCFILMIGVMVIKCIKDHRRARRRRLPYSALNKVPTAKYRKNDPFETCAICLEDFIEGEKLRILPCSHAYHCTCIDPWLTGSRRLCPMCKRKVFVDDERVDSDDSSSDEDDHTPLLRGRTPQSTTTTYGGTNVRTTVEERIVTLDNNGISELVEELFRLRHGWDIVERQRGVGTHEEPSRNSDEEQVENRTASSSGDSDYVEAKAFQGFSNQRTAAFPNNPSDDQGPSSSGAPEC